MQLVKEKWLRLQNVSLILLGILAAGGAIAGIALELDPNIEKYLLPNPFTIYIGLACIVFGLFRPILNRYFSKWLHAYCNIILQIALVAYFMRNTGVFASPYVGLWYLIAFEAGVLGYYFNIAFVFAGLMLFVALQPNSNEIEISAASVAFLIAPIFISLLSFFVWRKAYVGPEDDRLEEINENAYSKEKLSNSIINSLPEAVILVSNENKINLFNPTAKLLSGWEIKDAKGLDPKSVFKFVDDKGNAINNTDNPFNEVLLKKEPVKKTLNLSRKDGQVRIVSAEISPFFVDKDKYGGMIIAMRDITDDLKKQRGQADFISTASHEMRTPVAAIEGYLALAMNDKVTKIDSKAREFLEKAHASTQHLGKLFQDLLTSSKAEDGRLTSHPTVVEMGEFVEQLAEDLRFPAEKKGLDVEFLVSSGVKKGSIIDTSSTQKQIQPMYYCYIDPDRIREVLTNLFDNAVKYTETGKISLSLTGNDQVVQVSIKDTGAGIPKDDIPHLFQKFYRVDNSSTRAIGGTGLGLFICKKIVELYNGIIWADSELGKGSVFYINIPRLSAMEAEKIKTGKVITPVSV